MNNSKDKMYLLIQSRALATEQELDAVISDWLVLCRLLSPPLSYSINEETSTRPFSLSAIASDLKALLLQPDSSFTIAVQAVAGDFWVEVSNFHVKECFVIPQTVFLANEVLLVNYSDKRMIKNGCYAFLRSFEEYLCHNTSSLTTREAEGLTYPEVLPKMYDQQHQEIVDCSQLSGYDFHYKELCFTSCWKLWVSAAYYHLIPRQAFLELQQVEEVRSLPNEVVSVTLYEDPLNWQHPRNIAFQFLYRDQLGFDQWEWRNGVGVLRAPKVEYISLGEQTQLIHYQNDFLQPVIKSLASHFTTRVFNYRDYHYLSGRRFGLLNSLAYFPWQDQRSKQMVANRIINPSQMLDGGEAAFAFYINQYLNLGIEELKTKDYARILRFFVPQEVLALLPLDALVNHYRQEHYRVAKDLSAKRLLKIATEVTELQVEFVDLAWLKKLEGELATSNSSKETSPH